MREMDDMALLREYTARQSETAFATLVERHIGLVYCAALRQARDPAQAQEITQVVFILLARKAHSLREGTILSAWLYRAARFAASDARKMAFRRQQREQQAFQMQTISAASSDEPGWEQIAPLLDEAMAALGEKDRNAVMLRYFEQKSLEEVGVALGIGTVTAQKRVWRAVDKLRQYFSRHGEALSAEGITAALSAHAIHGVPSGLAAAVAATAALKGTAATASTATLIKGTLKLMFWFKMKTVVVVGVGVLLAAATITPIRIHEIRARPDYWQIRDFTVATLENARPQVTILPAKFGPESGGWMVWPPDGKLMGIGVPVEEMIQAAYLPVKGGVTYFRTRTVPAVPLPRQRYDFISNLDQGASNALQRAISEKFGLAIWREARETNVLVLSVRDPNVAGLRPVFQTASHLQPGGASLRGGHFSATNYPIQELALSIEDHLGIPVIDQTGLTGRFSFDVKWDEPDPKHRNPEGLKQALLDQIGLELTSKVQPIEMLVIEKAN